MCQNLAAGESSNCGKLAHGNLGICNIICLGCAVVLFAQTLMQHDRIGMASSRLRPSPSRPKREVP
eukprot:1867429-Amphidinium_carterae.1